jgi:cytochrome c
MASLPVASALPREAIMREMLLIAAVVVSAAAVGMKSARAADVAQGEQVFKKCERCHTLGAGGAQQEGPNLHGIFGRKAGTAPGWTYSEAMKNSNVVWTKETLDAYLAKPKEFIPDSTMNFPGLRKPEDREAVSTYLEQATK